MSLLKVAGTTASSGTLYVDDVFSTWLYTGNGSTQTITNGIDLAGKGGLVWTKDRVSATNTHKLTDTARGYQYAIQSSDTNAQEDNGTAGISSFGTTGYVIGSDWRWNKSADTYASWTFRKAAKFFDVVTYTGTSSARTIAHSLGVAPGMVIVKRTDTTGNWQVYSNGLTSAAYSIQLNLTDAQASAPTVWNSTAPTSSVFSVGTDATVNASGGTYVAYLYAHDTDADGIIQCGSFTTDGSGNATVNLGWEPQYVIIKCASSSANWAVFDNMRGMPVGNTNVARLFPNTSAAETLATDYNASPNATGFKFLATGYPSGTFIYMAIRMPNKPPTSGTQVFSPNITTGATPQTATTNFPVDMIWNRQQSNISSTYDGDRLRGNSVALQTNSTAAEFNAANLWAFDLQNSVQASVSSNQNINWNFKRAPGFFDEVCYTGTGSATTQAHNLGVAPELMIVKCRSTVTDWAVYNSDLGSTKYLWLDSTNPASVASSYWNNTSPTPTNFSVKDNSQTNTSGATYVAYLFATLAGISKVGSYTGNGTGQAIACGFSAGARFVLIKRTDSTGDWYTFDSARGLTSGSSPYLLLNSTAAETTGNNGVYASTGGFTLGSTASTTTNINGASYIYLSVA